MSSSSSDSEDENIALLRQAVDTNFISDGMFEQAPSSTSEVTSKPKDVESSKSTDPIKTTTSSLKSQRYMEFDEIETDLKVPKTMQDFIYKKMSKKIEDSVEFVEISSKKSKKRKNEDVPCVRLLNDTDPITNIDFVPSDDSNSLGGQKLEVKRRIVEPDGLTEDEKLKLVSVDGESILQKTDTKNWRPKKEKPNKVFKYREKNSILYEIDPVNEFTKLRKKNNWSESKIATFPWKKHNQNA